MLRALRSLFRNAPDRPAPTSTLGLHSYSTESLTGGLPDPRPSLRIVDNRTFLLGLDYLYREAIKAHERTELLACARAVAGVLNVGPANVPIEGYYGEQPALTDYFQLMRALQQTELARATSIEHLPEFQRLLEVTSSPIYGIPIREKLLPAGRDPLSEALRRTTQWEVTTLTDLAGCVARETDDISLVGLAARAGDAVIITALRESVVLYAEVLRLGSRQRPLPSKFRWEVDDDLARQAERFVETFNGLFGENLPQPRAANAKMFFDASLENRIEGRCARIGFDQASPPNQYHWALRRSDNGTLAVDEFWDSEIWTTDRYREKNRIAPRAALMIRPGVPSEIPPYPADGS